MIHHFETILDGQRLTGLRAGTGNANGLVLALHGGGYDARYWHASADSDCSLPRLGAQLSYGVLSIDRPGYAGSKCLSRRVIRWTARLN